MLNLYSVFFFFLLLNLFLNTVGGWICKVRQVLQRYLRAESLMYLAGVVDLREPGTLNPILSLKICYSLHTAGGESNHVVSCSMTLLLL